MKLKIVSRYPRYPGIASKTVVYPESGYASVEDMRAELRRRWSEKSNTTYVKDIDNGCQVFDNFLGLEQDITLEDK